MALKAVGSKMLKDAAWHRIRDVGGLVLFVAATLALAYFTIRVGVQDKPNKLAASLLQVMTILFGVLTANAYSKVSVEAAARDVIRPHARASIRRSVNLYKALGRQTVAVAAHLEALGQGAHLDEHGTSVVSMEAVRWSMVSLDGLVREQLATAADALEDWRDIVPDEVSSIFVADEEAEDEQ